MAQKERDPADTGHDGLHDVADEAQEQMPGKPPNLTYDPSRPRRRDTGRRKSRKEEKA